MAGFTDRPNMNLETVVYLERKARTQQQHDCKINVLFIHSSLFAVLF